MSVLCRVRQRLGTGAPVGTTSCETASEPIPGRSGVKVQFAGSTAGFFPKAGSSIDSVFRCRIEPDPSKLVLAPSTMIPDGLRRRPTVQRTWPSSVRGSIGTAPDWSSPVLNWVWGRVTPIVRTVLWPLGHVPDGSPMPRAPMFAAAPPSRLQRADSPTASPRAPKCSATARPTPPLAPVTIKTRHPAGALVVVP